MAGGYSPDFYADIAGTHYLLEVKADKDVATEMVVRKRGGCRGVGTHGDDTGEHGTWRYLLVPESVLGTAKTLAAALSQAASATG